LNVINARRGGTTGILEIKVIFLGHPVIKCKLKIRIIRASKNERVLAIESSIIHI
jgi:hypothetical protein